MFYSLGAPRLRALLDAIADIVILDHPRRSPAHSFAPRTRSLGQAAQFGQIGDEP